MRAAVFHGPQQNLTIEEIDHDQPRPDEVVVRTAASGVCHSDLHFVDGFYALAAPAVLGHEASGVVEAVGSAVTEFAPGDPRDRVHIGVLRALRALPERRALPLRAAPKPRTGR